MKAMAMLEERGAELVSLILALQLRNWGVRHLHFPLLTLLFTQWCTHFFCLKTHGGVGIRVGGTPPQQT